MGGEFCAVVELALPANAGPFPKRVPPFDKGGVGGICLKLLGSCALDKQMVEKRRKATWSFRFVLKINPPCPPLSKGGKDRFPARVPPFDKGGLGGICRKIFGFSPPFFVR